MKINPRILELHPSSKHLRWWMAYFLMGGLFLSACERSPNSPESGTSPESHPESGSHTAESVDPFSPELPDPGVFSRMEETDRDEVLAAGIPHWMETDAAACMGFLTKLNPIETRMRWMEEAVSQYAEKNPAAAAKLADAHLDPEENQDAFLMVAESWVAVAPQAAITWATTHGVEDADGELMQHTLDAWAESDPMALLTHLARTEDLADHILASGIESAALELVSRDAPAAARWALEQETLGAGGDPLVTVFSTWAEEDPSAAAYFAGKNVPENKLKEVYSAIGTSWSEENPKAALGWAGRIPAAHPARMHALIAAFEAAADSPEIVAESLARLPPDEAKVIRERLEAMK